MHQSSFRILRWTDDDRPYTKDFQDLFCTLMVALPLETHTNLFTRYPHTFTTREALNHLGNLRFTQTNRRPSPDDPNVMVTTKIATTFSMVEPMARNLCGKFLNARLIEQIRARTMDDDPDFRRTKSLWQLTPKGIKLLQNFANRNGVQERHVYELLDSPRNFLNLLVLERDAETDQLSSDRGTIEVSFRRFAGTEKDAPAKSSASSNSDSESYNEVPSTSVGIKQVQKRFGPHLIPVFAGKAAIDWLMNNCTLVDEREAQEIIGLFLKNGLIELVQDDKSSPSREGRPCPPHAYFRIGIKGYQLISPDAAYREQLAKANGPRDSNTTRMTMIVQSPSLRLMFREYLRDTHCEENLLFYLEVKDFLGRWSPALQRYSPAPAPHEMLSEILAAAYDLYNAFLAPGSPCELNIDHNLRNALVGRMTKFELPDSELHRTVEQVMNLYDQAQNSVFKLMASDSVPKFLREERYQKALREYNNIMVPANYPPLLDPDMAAEPLSASSAQTKDVSPTMSGAAT